MSVPPLTELQCRHIRRAFPDTGEKWINDYPALVQRCAERWSLVRLEKVDGGYPSNAIFFAVDENGQHVVLKLGHPNPELLTEILALRAYAGRQAVNLIDTDPGLPALLLERIMPGTMLRHTTGRAGIRLEIFATLGWPCEGFDGLPSYRQWIEGAFCEFRERAKPDDRFHTHIDRAERLFDEIDADSWFLHGDLHHENLLLDDRRGWVAIDPKGVIGPRVMECGRFLHNFLDDEIDASGDVIAQMAAVVGSRCEAFAGVMGETPGDLAKAGYVDAVLGTCWTLNDGNTHPSREVEAIATLVA